MFYTEFFAYLWLFFVGLLIAIYLLSFYIVRRLPNNNLDHILLFLLYRKKQSQRTKVNFQKERIGFRICVFFSNWHDIYQTISNSRSEADLADHYIVLYFYFDVTKIQKHFLCCDFILYTNVHCRYKIFYFVFVYTRITKPFDIFSNALYSTYNRQTNI